MALEVRGVANAASKVEWGRTVPQGSLKEEIASSKTSRGSKGCCKGEHSSGGSATTRTGSGGDGPDGPASC